MRAIQKPAFYPIRVLAFLLVTLPSGALLVGADFYVKADATGANNGRNWDDAMTDLQTALDAAFPGDEIWVAAGTYRPSRPMEPEDPRTATFQLQNNVALYGGFAGTELTFDQRDPALNETVLSGDLEGNDGPDFSGMEENSYSVVFSSGTNESAILDGFTINAGNSNAPVVSNLSNSDFRRMGGGIFNDDGSPTIANCRIAGNLANSGGGGGMSTTGDSSPKLTSCVLSCNSALFGGAMAVRGQSEATLTNCTLTKNSALQVGGIYAWTAGGKNTVEMTGCRVTINSGTALWAGGTLTDCTIAGNGETGVSSGGCGPLTATNCLIVGNGSHGIASFDPVTVESCTIVRNGGVGVQASVQATNCIVWGNAKGSGGINAIYSCIEGDWVSPGTGNINEDPLLCSERAELFVDDQEGFDEALTPGLALSLAADSPCLGTGENGVDMGAPTGICDGDPGEERLVHLAPGTYRTDLLSLGDHVSLQGADEDETILEGTVRGLRTAAILSGVTVRGGTEGGIVVDNGEAPEIRDCTITENEGALGGGIACLEGASPEITRCTISSNLAVEDGGGLYCDGTSSPTVTDCTITDNVAQKSGGGVCIVGGTSDEDMNTPELTGCTISGNSAVSGAGVIAVGWTAPTLTDCTLSGNSASRDGGGFLSVAGAAPALVDCRLTGNTATRAGGGMCALRASLTLARCEVSGNSAASGAGGFSSESSLALHETPVDDLVEVATRVGPDIYVRAAAEGAATGTSWADAYTDLQSALDSAFPGDEIWVAEGTYLPTKRYMYLDDPRAALFTIENGMALYGGFAGSETSLEERDFEAHPTILSADRNGDDGPDFTNRDDNCYQVVMADETDDTTVFDGFTITGGKSDQELPNLDFTRADFRHGGGGMSAGDLTIANCAFISNQALGGGGLSPGDATVVINCRFIGNQAGCLGFGCAGGGARGGNGAFINCVFVGNTSDSGGGLGTYARSFPTLINCTFTANSPYAISGGEGSSPNLINCIVWENGEGPFDLRSGSSATAAYSCIDSAEPWPGEGNINDDPFFVDEGDYHLLPESPAIDAGTPDGAPGTDIEGNERPCGEGVDMGAYENDCGGPPEILFVRGDCNGDGSLAGVTDAMVLLSYNFAGTAKPACFAACDVNGDGRTSGVTDAVYLLTYSFGGGPAPVAPFPECGIGALPSDQVLGCESPSDVCR